MISESELDQIIRKPKMTESRPLNSEDVNIYFETCGGQFEPSWKFMDKDRMLYLFKRFKNIPKLSEQTLWKIAQAEKEIAEAH